MLRKKSTSPAIPIGQLAKHCSKLIKSKNFHTQELLYFTRQFNQSQEPDLSAGIPELTPEQTYFQMQAEHHRAELARVDKAITDLQTAA